MFHNRMFSFSLEKLFKLRKDYLNGHLFDLHNVKMCSCFYKKQRV